MFVFMEDRGIFRHTPINAVLNNRLIQGVPSMAVKIKASYSRMKKYLLMNYLCQECKHFFLK